MRRAEQRQLALVANPVMQEEVACHFYLHRFDGLNMRTVCA
jgi:hypothetical protein